MSLSTCGSFFFYMQKSFYFQHDYNAASDAKILFLRQQLGMEGYGIYWFILEQLAQAGGYLPLKIIPVLAMQSQTQETKVKAVIEGYDLFRVIHEQFFSLRLNEHLEIRRHLSKKGKEGAINRWRDRGAIRGAIGEGNSDPNAKERKGNKGKEIKERENTPPEEIFYRIEECLTIALNDPRWVKANKATESEVSLFNNYLEKTGRYEMNPADYKKYFATIKGKYPELLKRTFTIEELREIAKQEDLKLKAV